MCGLIIKIRLHVEAVIRDADPAEDVDVPMEVMDLHSLPQSLTSFLPVDSETFSSTTDYIRSDANSIYFLNKQGLRRLSDYDLEPIVDLQNTWALLDVRQEDI
jgi:hypothetical protein